MGSPRAAHRLALALLALALALAGCGGSDNGSDGSAREAADQSSATTAGDAAPRHGAQAQNDATAPDSSGDSAASAPGQGPQPLAQDLEHPKKSQKPPKAQSGGKPGGPTGLSAQDSATYETARALCANRDSLQYAPEEIRDDAEAMAEFAERFAPAGEEQVVHDGCLAGLKSIGIG